MKLNLLCRIVWCGVVVVWCGVVWCDVGWGNKYSSRGGVTKR